MIILSDRCVGSIFQCECGAVLAYKPEDIQENHFIYCPVCKIRQRVPLDLEYDGVIEDEKSEK